MKKYLATLVLVVLLFSQLSFAHDFPTLMQVNGQFIQSETVIIDGKNYAPARLLSDVLGITVEWDAENQASYFYRGDKRIVVKGEDIYTYLNWQPQGLKEFKAHNVNWTTYLPVGCFVNFFGYEYSYNSNLKIINIKAGDVTLSEAYLAPSAELHDDLKWLARIVNIEARDASIYKRAAVANVVLNRVKSASFPNSVYDVVKQQGQFPPAYYSYFDTFEPDTASYVAALHAMNGHNNIENCLYFNLVPFSWKSKSDFYKEIEGDYFYR